MLLMLLIGWIVLLPALVVSGLYIGSTVLGRRQSVLSVYEDLFADDTLDTDDIPIVTPEAITGVRPTSDVPGSPARPVGAGY